ncbi:energy-coupled thiamine transporter ThiT [Atopococcus tabaci]|uniref:energy-coupled thiamine transporter ThiT n=1 Tax=Atopococcus tabaci TaxID=269774 RepID=UPI0024099AD8|nr:energy-coupled thiamine transporter ThiT [Atopococcus tabaci]
MNNIRVWIEGTIVAALAIVLSLLPTNIGPSLTLSLGMIPLTLYALRRGMTAGFVAGFLWGVLHFLLGNAVIWTFLQGLIEYFIAFSFAGAAGIVSSRIQVSADKKHVWSWIVAASFLGAGARFFWHFIAGVIFWGSYAPEGMSPIVYSFVTNGLSALVTAIATALILIFIHSSTPRVFFAE